MSTEAVSERFSAADADLTISSSNGVVFKVHRKHLEVHSDVFADATNATLPHDGNNEVVKLSESSAVLELLFQYVYRQHQPSLKDVEFSICAGLAEAAEKYIIYSALPAVRNKMRESIPQHSLHVLEYAVRHDLKEIANEAARASLDIALPTAASTLSFDTFARWLSFSDKWHRDARDALHLLVCHFDTDKDRIRTLAPYIKSPGSMLMDRKPLEELVQAAATPWRSYQDLLKFLDSEFMPLVDPLPTAEPVSFKPNRG